MEELLCNECGSKLEVCDAPSPWFSIPFTKIEIWRWERQTYCLECVNDQDRRLHEEIYDSGAQDGYESGFRDGSRA